MKIAIDARMLTYSGIGRYIQNLIINLSKIDKENKYSILISNNDSAPVIQENFSYCNPKRNIQVYSLKEQLFLPFDIVKTKANIIHYPNFNIPILNFMPFVATIHDIYYYLHPEACPSKAAYLYARLMLKAAARFSKKIITVSQFSRNEIIKHLNVKTEKVVVIYNGVGEIYKPISDPIRFKEARDRYNIKDAYIFYAGIHQPRKNLINLIRAYSMLRNKKDFQLALGGKIDPRRGEIYHIVNELGLNERVLFLGEVPEGDLPVLYSMASLFVFPSLYEGFGLPPLEAMACGAPVVASDAASLPEIVGDAAIMVDPKDINLLAYNMERVLSSNSLQAELKERGFKRAKLFNWQNTAKETLKIYYEVAEAL